ncbi:MAG: CheY-like chemotaxis protein/DNA-binding XRE family transcriptional regulator [Gammaproteobacteria bacterium]|jgi:CheY-like chemotaxis protein/DNA-binding XRE family transcriptional regulator
MSNKQINWIETTSSISDRLIFLRNKKKLTLAYVAKLFNVNKSTVLRWETNEYWMRLETANKRLLLMQLVELYQADYGWVLHGRSGIKELNTNILLIDDDVTSLSILTLITKSLLATDFKLFSFIEPYLALDWAEKHSSAFVFCDYRMPGMKGDVFMKRLRVINTYETTPIIAITQVREPGMFEKLIDAGATHVMQKPVNQEKLQVLLKTYNCF